jgi:hypothetical protein
MRASSAGGDLALAAAVEVDDRDLVGHAAQRGVEEAEIARRLRAIFG